MNKVKISVIIPIYNAQNYLGECLDSIVSQTLKEIEIICIDDGSTDASFEIMRKYSEMYANITVFQQENQGAGPAKNRGIACAKGKYVCFIDADDYYAGNQVLESLYMRAEEYDVLACGGNLMTSKGNGETEKRRNWFRENKKIQFTEYGDPYYYTCFIFDRKVIQDNYITFPPYRRYEDPPFLLCVMGCIKEFYAITEVVYIYREGHKDVKYDFNIVCDIMRGVRDCHGIARKYNLNKTYDEYLKNSLKDYFALMYPYVIHNEEEICTLYNEINEIRRKWKGDVWDVVKDREHMEKFVKELNQCWDDIVSQCQVAKKVIIYGAGKVGKKFFRALKSEGIHAAGFAVSKQKMGDIFEGQTVKKIDDYDRDTLVVIAVGEKNAREIWENLKLLRFQRVCYMKYEDFLLLESIKFAKNNGLE